MKICDKSGDVSDGLETTPDQLIAYLSYGLEDVRCLSYRSALLLANAIVALAEDANLDNADEIRQSIRNDLTMN